MIHIICPPFVEGNNLRYLTNAIVKAMDFLSLKYSLTGYLSGQQPTRRTSGFYNMDAWMPKDIDNVNAMLHSSALVDGDYIFYIDFWSPSVIQLKTHCILNNINVKFVGWYHGSSTLSEDYLSHLGHNYLLQSIEIAMFNCYDEIWFASKFFTRGIPESIISGIKKKMCITGEPFHTSDYINHRNTDRENKKYDVVVPFRTDKDKIDINELKYIIEDNPKITFLLTSPVPGEVKFVYPNVTMKIGSSDSEHIEDLASCKVVLSTAHQEGWGYAVMKAVTVGCIPVLPNRAVYPELYEVEYLYRTPGYASKLIQLYVKGYPVKAFYPDNYNMRDAVEKTFIGDIIEFTKYPSPLTSH